MVELINHPYFLIGNCHLFLVFELILVTKKINDNVSNKYDFPNSDNFKRFPIMFVLLTLQKETNF
jgi:hypothetical protein